MLSCTGADLAELEAWSDSTELFDPIKTTTKVIMQCEGILCTDLQY